MIRLVIVATVVGLALWVLAARGQSQEKPLGDADRVRLLQAKVAWLEEANRALNARVAYFEGLERLAKLKGAFDTEAQAVQASYPGSVVDLVKLTVTEAPKPPEEKKQNASTPAPTPAQ